MVRSEPQGAMNKTLFTEEEMVTVLREADAKPVAEVAKNKRATGRSNKNRDIVAVLVISDLEFGGAQRQVVELANQLELANVRTYVCSLSPYVPLAEQLAKRDQLVIIRRRWRFDITVVFRLAWFLRQVQADVIHAFLFDAEVASRLAGRLARRPAVIGSERNTHYAPNPRDTFVLRLTRSCLDLVVANSRSGADYNSELIGYPRDRYRVVRNGVDVLKFRPRSSHELRASLGIPPHALVVGMFASFKAQKNHALL
jgi:glycosyltransferase involved in cell wall biosynthesis